jgi:hypothetical protein
MKLLLCQQCLDIVTPDSSPLIIRYCNCKKSGCFWDNPLTGEFAIYNASKQARVLGIHNGLLTKDGMGADTVQEIISNTPDNYLFKSWNSLIVMIYPGFSYDTRWATEEEIQEKHVVKYTPV